MSHNRVSKIQVGSLLTLLFLGFSGASTKAQENYVLLDEIHTFTPPGSTLFIDALFFQQAWYYELSFEVVSPHQCQANITITDPEGFCYYVYSGVVLEEKSSLLYGAACSGVHSLAIELETNVTLNFQIQVVKIGEILDILAISGRLIITQAIRFFPSDSCHKVAFILDKSDACSIRFFPITPFSIDSKPFINLSLQDPHFQIFSLYQGMLEKNRELEFQTNSQGEHLLIIDIKAIESPLNVMVIVTLDSSNSKIRYTVPLEAQLVTGTILLFLLLIPYLILRKVEK